VRVFRALPRNGSTCHSIIIIIIIIIINAVAAATADVNKDAKGVEWRGQILFFLLEGVKGKVWEQPS
jgi:hypothetical protein